MKQVVFWGTRGLVPVALTARDVREKITAALIAADGKSFKTREALAEFVNRLPFSVNGTFGGHTACVEIAGHGEEHIVCDMGTGARPMGHAKLARYGSRTPQTYHLFISQLHADHLMGFPYFAPIYIPGNRIVIHGCHAGLEAAVRQQMRGPEFPIDYTQTGAEIEFDLMVPGEPHPVAGLTVTPRKQIHPGDSYGYRFEGAGRCVVYSTDAEHPVGDTRDRAAFIQFFEQADLVIYDAMYSLAEAVSVKEEWGHSSNVHGIELCLAAGVKRLALFNHEPSHDDLYLSRIAAESQRLEQITRAQRSPLEIVAAYDGLALDL